MKTRKILKMILAAAVCLGMIVAAAACGKNSNDETTAPQTLPDASATVTEAEESSSMPSSAAISFWDFCSNTTRLNTVL